jgi:FKBP-type peptidyl-prolyl cis-trans isomerase FklB
MQLKSGAPSWLPRACTLLLATVSIGALADDQKPAAATAADADSVSYSAGVSVGEGLHRAGITTEIDLAAFTRGFKDALAGRTTTPEDRERLTRFMADLRNTIGARNKDAARDFLARNGKEKGVVTTASGLQYKVIEAGDRKAAAPAASDEVTVQYRGKLLDGTEFDSSYARGTPAKFPINGVIKGWQEALVLMKPGAKWQLFVPPDLAYDMNSRPPIPPGSLLVFDVELVSVGASSASSAAPAPAPTK